MEQTESQPETPKTVEADEQVDGPVEAESPDGEAPAAVESTINPAELEALLFSTHHPLTAGRLAELLEAESTKFVRQTIRDLNAQYESGNHSFRIEQVAGGYQMLTLPAFAPMIKKHQMKEADAKLTKAALETLAIIAYKQPILRANIEAIRGVASGETVRSLMEKHLVKIAGRADEPGRPILYGTTKRFLEIFGLNSLKDLPKGDEELKPKLPQPKEAKAGASRDTAADESAAQSPSEASPPGASPASASPVETSTGDAPAVDASATDVPAPAAATDEQTTETPRETA